MGVFATLKAPMTRGLAVMVRTIWFAGFLLLIIGGLLAMKMVSAAASAPDEAPGDETATLTQIVPGENTLTAADRSVVAPDTDEAPLFPIVSSSVRSARAEFKPSAIIHGRTARTAATPAKPRMAGRPASATDKSREKTTDKSTDVKSCRQLDPIARFLVSANLAPRCAG
jgi:hypothetical protein